MSWRRETKVELLNQAFKGSITTSVFSSIAAFLFTFLLWDQVPQYVLLPWFLLFFVSQILRIGGALLKQKNHLHSFQYWKRTLFLTVLPSSFMWGIFPILSFPHVDATTRTIIAIFIATAPTAQLLSTGSVFTAWLISMFLLLIPMCITWLFYGTSGITLGIIGFLYIGYLYAIGQKFYTLMGEKIELRYKADAASKAKTTFLATASHDLRQPLHAMTMSLAATQTLMSHENPNKNELQAALVSLKTMEGSVDGLTRLLNALLDVSKIESGSIKLSFSTLPISNLFEFINRTYAARAREKKLNLKIIPSSLKIQSDPIYLQRIVGNLVSNAIRHVPSGRILIGCKRKGENLLIQVIDTGPGIPPERFRDIFDEFSQLDNPGRHTSAGLGLGLAIADRMANALGHGLMVNSVPGQGSAFSLEVPISLHQQSINDTKPNISEKSGDRRAHLIVLIHPKIDILEETAVQVRNWGYRVLAFQSCEEAQALQIRPQIIIAAQKLPSHLNGFEAINILRGTWKTKNAGIVLTTTLDPETLLEANTYNCQIIPSPPEPGEFKKLLQEAIYGGA